MLAKPLKFAPSKNFRESSASYVRHNDILVPVLLSGGEFTIHIMVQDQSK